LYLTLFQALWNPRSETIEAILQLQNKVSEYSEKGNIITRLLVPSSKVGCILGQGGHVINEMRRRTQADIRVYSKDDKPKCAADDEELVQVMGLEHAFLLCNMPLLLLFSDCFLNF
jgi:polyribonucleotide nucleotidyltransferase